MKGNHKIIFDVQFDFVIEIVLKYTFSIINNFKSNIMICKAVALDKKFI